MATHLPFGTPTPPLKVGTIGQSLFRLCRASQATLISFNSAMSHATSKAEASSGHGISIATTDAVKLGRGMLPHIGAFSRWKGKGTAKNGGMQAHGGLGGVFQAGLPQAKCRFWILVGMYGFCER